MNAIKLLSVSALISIAAMGCRSEVRVEESDKDRKCTINPKTGTCYELAYLNVMVNNATNTTIKSSALPESTTVIKGNIKCENESKARNFELNSEMTTVKIFKQAFCDIVLTDVIHADLTYFPSKPFKVILTPMGDIIAKEALFNTELDQRINVKMVKEIAKNATITIETATARHILDNKDDIHTVTSDKELSDSLGFTVQTVKKETAKVTFTRLVDTHLNFTNKKITREVTSHYVMVDYTDHFKRGATMYGLGTQDLESVDTTRDIGGALPITAENTHIHFFNDEGEVVDSMPLYADNVKNYADVEAGFPAIIKEETMTAQNLTAVKSKLNPTNNIDKKLIDAIDLLIETMK